MRELKIRVSEQSSDVLQGVVLGDRGRYRLSVYNGDYDYDLLEPLGLVGVLTTDRAPTTPRRFKTLDSAMTVARDLGLEELRCPLVVPAGGGGE